MQITVFGVRKGEYVMQRTVTMLELVQAWGPWWGQVLSATADRPLIVGDRAVWSKVER